MDWDDGGNRCAALLGCCVGADLLLA